MSPELQTRIRRYADHLEQLAAPVEFDEVLDRTAEPITLPEVERRVRRHRLRVAAAAAVVVAALIGGAAYLLGNLGSEFVEEPTATTQPTASTTPSESTPATEATTPPEPSTGLTIGPLLSGTDLRHPVVDFDDAGHPVVTLQHFDTQEIEIIRCTDLACTDFESNIIPITGIEPSVFAAFTGDGDPVIVVAAIDAAPILYRCADPACGDYQTTDLDGLDGIGNLWLDPAGNPVVLIWAGDEPGPQLITCNDPTCTDRTSASLEDAGGWLAMTYGSDGFPFFVRIDHDPEQRVNPVFAIHCSDAACASGTTVTPLVDAPENTYNAAVAIGGSGTPVIALGNRQIQVLTCADVACTELEAISTVGPRMIIDGLTLIAHSEQPVLVMGATHTESDWSRPVLAVCDEATCATGTIGTVDDLPSVWVTGAGSNGSVSITYGTLADLFVASCDATGCADGLIDPARWDQSPPTPSQRPSFGPTMEGWVRVPHDEAVFGRGGGGTMYSVVEAGPGLIAVGDRCELANGQSVCDATIWTSSDGTTWKPSAGSTDLGGRPRAVAELAGRQIVVGGNCPEPDEDGMGPCDAAVWASSDGTSWERIPIDRDVFGCPGEPEWCDFELAGVIAGADGLLTWGSGFEGHQLYTSTDGVTWRHLATPDLPAGTMISDVVAVGDRLVALGSTWVDIFDDSGEWVGFEEDLTVLISDDGVAWTAPTDPSFADGSVATAVVWARGITIFGYVCDETWTCTDQVWNSPDGLAWSRTPLQLGVEGAGLSAATPGGPGLIATGSYYDELAEQGTTLFWVSSDGVNWQIYEGDASVFGDGSGINDFARLGDRLVGVGASSVERAPAVWVWGP